MGYDFILLHPHCKNEVFSIKYFSCTSTGWLYLSKYHLTEYWLSFSKQFQVVTINKNSYLELFFSFFFLFLRVVCCRENHTENSKPVSIGMLHCGKTRKTRKLLNNWEVEIKSCFPGLRLSKPPWKKNLSITCSSKPLHRIPGRKEIRP